MKKLLLGVALCAGAVLVLAQGRAEPAAEMAAAAQQFVGSLAAEQRGITWLPYEHEERQNWHYIPRPRFGVPIKDLNPQQRELGAALVRSAMSEEGFDREEKIRLLDQVLFDRTGSPIRDPELYFYSVFGQPGTTGTWGWRLEGHHLSLNFSLRDGRVAFTPLFMGANPAKVGEGKHAGLRVLAGEEELGRQLLKSLPGGKRRKAIFAESAPVDILASPGKGPRLPAQGLSAQEMTPEQSRLLMDLIELYARRLRRELADAEMARIRQAGVEKVYFAWAGGTEAGQPHYYRIQGPTFLIEYDNTQDNANHIHTVWRNPEGDFGPDPLRAHYANSPHHATLRARHSHRHAVSPGREALLAR
jgi:hypothetical protein